ncbi:MAG: response regulator [Bacteroidia bacterium]|nr:response regulator [Bacteroidia bacterium]
MSSEKSNVTIIDDDFIYVKVLSERLSQNSKIKVAQYASGEDFLANIDLAVPKILITDYYLNSQNVNAINGSELVKRIRSLYPGMAVIVLSGRADLSSASKTQSLFDALEINPSGVQKLLDDGAFFYVMKDRNAPNKIYEIVDVLVRKVFGN